MAKRVPKVSTFSSKHKIEILLNGINSTPDPYNIPIVFAANKMFYL